MSLRIGVDLDGTLADLSAMYHQYEEAIFGEASTADESDAEIGNAEEKLAESEAVGEKSARYSAESGEKPADKAATNNGSKRKELSDSERMRLARQQNSRHESVWRALKNTPDLWTLLKPIEPRAVKDLYAAMLAHKWEVFFITQRPGTAGATVQAQTQKWLMAHGFETPSVLTLTGSRGKAAHALDLDFLIDDLPKNCIDVISDSKCRPILVLRQEDVSAEIAAKRLNIGIVRSVAEAISLLVQPAPEPRESTVAKVLRRLGLSR
jgi:phosphoglycolate phosphatase-like HAD superfamily hydrolase